MLVGVGVTLRLGVWQLDRADEKQSRHDNIVAQQSAPVLQVSDVLSTPSLWQNMHQRVFLQGQWLSQHTVYLENRPMKGQTGFWVITPLQIDANTLVLVQRGWVPRHRQDRAQLPPVATPLGEVQLSGRIAPLPSDLLQLGAVVSPPEAVGTSSIRHNLEPEQYQRDIGQPWKAVVLQTDAPSDGLLREWPAIAAGVEKNLGYAFQWFALAAVQVLLFLWFQFVKPYLYARHAKN